MGPARPERSPSEPTWPTATLDPVARLRVLAAALPGAALTEERLDADVATVWGFVGDLERSVPSFDRAVERLVVHERDGSHLRISAHPWRRGPGLPMDVHLEPGFCWMWSRWRLYVVGMATVADGDGCRIGHLEGSALPGARLLRPVARLAVASDVAGISRIVAGRPQGHGGGHP